ncbi:hypothetical protein HWV62_26757 [Athelia sp. TMB]|nr:hypothetical protein HWV62_26757 [Athelia sp. TMB]
MEEEPEENYMIFIVSPLNLLSKQNVDTLQAAGISAISLMGENNRESAFQEIERFQYRVIVVSPEILMQNDGINGFAKLWRKPRFTNKILYFVFDEGHCISQWNSFRKEYLTICTLRYLIPERIPFYVASATLPAPVLLDVSEILRLRSSETEHVTLSCDRPDIHLVARPILYPLNTFHDLSFLTQVPPNFVDGVMPPPPTFLAFFDCTKTTEKVLHAARADLPPELRDKIRYFHAGMSQAYREEMYDLLDRGILWGLYATVAFGFGMDLPNIDIVAQWRATCDMSDLWQCFGRVARAIGREGTGILFFERAHLDKTRENKRVAAGKRKAVGEGPSGCPAKRAATSPTRQETEMAMEVDNDPEAYARQIEHEAAYNRRAAKQVKSRKAKNVKESRSMLDLHGPLDDFINAGTREEVACRHKPVKLYFDGPIRPAEHFDKLFLSPAPKKSARQRNRSTIPSYAPTKMDLDLKFELRSWRREQATAVLGRMTVRKWGDILFMSDEILQCIVDCAHKSKILTADHLAKETRWRREYVDQFADSLIEILDRYATPPPLAPPVLPISRVLAALAANDPPAIPPTKPWRQPIKCSACKGTGHNKSNPGCPAKSAFRHPHTAQNDENHRPVVTTAAAAGPSTPHAHRAPPTLTTQAATPNTSSFRFTVDFGTPTVPRAPSHTFNTALQFNPNISVSILISIGAHISANVQLLSICQHQMHALRSRIRHAICALPAGYKFKGIIVVFHPPVNGAETAFRTSGIAQHVHPHRTPDVEPGGYTKSLKNEDPRHEHILNLAYITFVKCHVLPLFVAHGGRLRTEAGKGIKAHNLTLHKSNSHSL